MCNICGRCNSNRNNGGGCNNNRGGCNNNRCGCNNNNECGCNNNRWNRAFREGYESGFADGLRVANNNCGNDNCGNNCNCGSTIQTREGGCACNN